MYRKILVIGADKLTSVTDWTDRNTCVLFGHGAGAVVLEPTRDGNGLLSFDLCADGNGARFLQLPAGGSLQPASHETVEGRLHYLHMEGTEVFKAAVKGIVESTQRVVEAAGLKISDVDVYIPHQANQRIIDAAGRRLGIASKNVFVNVEKYGNTSCASIPLAMSEAMDAGLLEPGKIVAMCAFGAGFTWGGMVMRWTHSRTRAVTTRDDTATARVTPTVTQVQSFISAH